jgi:hypothetical protein
MSAGDLHHVGTFVVAEEVQEIFFLRDQNMARIRLKVEPCLQPWRQRTGDAQRLVTGDAVHVSTAGTSHRFWAVFAGAGGSGARLCGASCGVQPTPARRQAKLFSQQALWAAVTYNIQADIRRCGGPICGCTIGGRVTVVSYRE